MHRTEYREGSHLPFQIVCKQAFFDYTPFITALCFSSELLLYPIINLYNTYTFYPNVFLLVTTIRLKQLLLLNCPDWW